MTQYFHKIFCTVLLAVMIAHHGDLLRLLPSAERISAISGCRCKGPVCCCTTAGSGHDVCGQSKNAKGDSQQNGLAFVNCSPASAALNIAKLVFTFCEILASPALLFPTKYKPILHQRNLLSADYQRDIEHPPRLTSSFC
jgi:hypothetical protein